MNTANPKKNIGYFSTAYGSSNTLRSGSIFELALARDLFLYPVVMSAITLRVRDDTKLLLFKSLYEAATKSLDLKDIRNTFPSLKDVKDVKLQEHFVYAAWSRKCFCCGKESTITCSVCGIERFCNARCGEQYRKKNTICRVTIPDNSCKTKDCCVCILLSFGPKRGVKRKPRPPVPLFSETQ